VTSVPRPPAPKPLPPLGYANCRRMGN
jgi:hypothetical protein